MILQEDREMLDWVYNITEKNAGHFLQSIAEAAKRADWENYPLMRPLLLELRAKYPKYASNATT